MQYSIKHQNALLCNYVLHVATFLFKKIKQVYQKLCNL